jgi:hypothetical protein
MSSGVMSFTDEFSFAIVMATDVICVDFFPDCFQRFFSIGIIW